MDLILRCDRIVPMDVKVPQGFRLITDHLSVIVEWDGVAGYVRGQHADGAWYLSNLMVTEELRGQGLGRALCQQLLKRLRRENALPLYAAVDATQIPALMLLISLGFKVQRTETFGQHTNDFFDAMNYLRENLTEQQLARVERNTSAEVRLCDITAIKYDKKGLVPAIAQDAYTGEVLMQAYMNEESLRKTLESGYATYYSRSRQQLWRKGETSGHTQKVIRLMYDCDGDCILMQVKQAGPACHTGATSCFHNAVVDGELPATSHILEDVMDTVRDRALNPQEGSYTNYLLDKGIEKICKKLGEESSEAIIAAMKGDKDELIGEASDLLYHLTVLLYERGVSWQDIWDLLAARHK